MNRFPSVRVHQDQRRSMHEVRLAFRRIVARMQGLARSAQTWSPSVGSETTKSEKKPAGAGGPAPAPRIRPQRLQPVLVR